MYVDSMVGLMLDFLMQTTTQFRPSEFDRELLSQTLPKFLITLYEYNPQDESRDIFHEIGIHRYAYMYINVCH